MDLQLYLRVLWRFRLIMALGLVLACVLSFLSFASISFAHGSPKVKYRQAETWKATVLVSVTQRGFPSGYTVMPVNPAKLADGTTQLIPRYGDPSRFSQVAILYAPLVRGDAFQAMLRQRTHVRGLIDAQPVVDPLHNLPEPFINLIGYAAIVAEPAGAGAEIRRRATRRCRCGGNHCDTGWERTSLSRPSRCRGSDRRGLE